MPYLYFFIPCPPKSLQNIFDYFRIMYGFHIRGLPNPNQVRNIFGLIILGFSVYIFRFMGRVSLLMLYCCCCYFIYFVHFVTNDEKIPNETVGLIVFRSVCTNRLNSIKFIWEQHIF